MPPLSNFHTPGSDGLHLGFGYLGLGSHALVVNPSVEEFSVLWAEVVLTWSALLPLQLGVGWQVSPP